MEAPDFIKAPHAVESVQVTSVARCKLARFKITAAEARVAKCVRRLPREKVKTQPASVGRRNALRFSEERYKQQKNQISVHLRLKFKVARKMFRRELAH